MRRFGPNNQPIRNISVEIPQELYRRLELEKGRTKVSIAKMCLAWLLPHLQQLPPSTPNPRIES
jgi:hypothetical protein